MCGILSNIHQKAQILSKLNQIGGRRNVQVILVWRAEGNINLESVTLSLESFPRLHTKRCLLSLASCIIRISLFSLYHPPLFTFSVVASITSEWFGRPAEKRYTSADQFQSRFVFPVANVASTPPTRRTMDFHLKDGRQLDNWKQL